MMKKINFVLLVALMCCYTNANAFFFFFIPGSATRGVSDAITGAKGNICVKEATKVGDVIPSLAGNTMKILSLSGTSSACANPALPIRADVEFTFAFKSNAGVNLSEDYEAKPTTDLQRYNGVLLMATSKTTRNKGVVINSREKKPTDDPNVLASNVEKLQISNLAEGVSKNAEQIKINGSNAWRFEVHGKTKGVFGNEMVYIITVLEGVNEIVVVNAYTQLSNYERDKVELQKVATEISGIGGIASPVTTQEIQQAPVTTTPQQTSSQVTATVNTSAPVANQAQQVEVQKSTGSAQDISSTTSQTSNKLRELSKMLNEGLITKQDYENKKAELLKSL